MTCAESEVRLHALLDGELDAGHAREVETRLETCPRCARQLVAYRELQQAMPAAQLRFTAPACAGASRPRCRRRARAPRAAADKPPKIAFRPETVSAEAETQPQMPANCGLFGRLREISRFERVRGGPGRTRTSNQIVMSAVILSGFVTGSIAPPGGGIGIAGEDEAVLRQIGVVVAQVQIEDLAGEGHARIPIEIGGQGEAT